MTNKPLPVTGGVPVDLDRARVMLFDFNALALIEAETGRNTLDPAFWENFPRTAADVRVFLWAALRDDDPDLTLEATGRLITGGNIDEIQVSLVAALAASMPEDDGDGGAAPEKGKKKASPKTMKTGG